MFLIRLCLLSVGGAPPKKNQSSFTDGKLMTVVSYSLQLARCYSFLEGLCHMMQFSDCFTLMQADVFFFIVETF